MLRESCILDTRRDEVEYDRLTDLASKLFDCPISLVSLVDLSRQWFKSSVGLPVSETHRNWAFCAYTVLEESPDVFVVLNSREDDRFRNNPLVEGAPNVIFYAGAALYVEGQKVGSLCIIDNKPRQSFSLKEKKILFDLGALVGNQIRWRRLMSLRCHRSMQMMLSLTHNINTLTTALHLQIESLLADFNVSLLAPCQGEICELLTEMNKISNDLIRRVSVILSLGRVLPSLCTNMQQVETSAYGPQCQLLQVFNGIQSLIPLAFPEIMCKVDTASFYNPQCAVQYCYVDVLLFVAYAVLISSVPCGALTPGNINIYFSEFEWSIHENDQERGRLQRNGELFISLRIPSVQLRLAEDERLVSMLAIVSGNQRCNPDDSEYIISVPCRLQEVDSIKNESQVNPMKRVLVVDDDAQSSMQLSRFLETECSCCVELASTGHQGVLCYNSGMSTNKKFDIMFVDLLMPASTGLDMMRQIGATEKPLEGVIVIAVIGVTDQFDQFMEDCDFDPSLFCFSYVIVKPYDMEFIKHVVQSLMSSSELCVDEHIKDSVSARHQEILRHETSHNNVRWWSKGRKRKVHPVNND